MICFHLWAGLDTLIVRKLLVDKLGLETESDPDQWAGLDTLIVY